MSVESNIPQYEIDEINRKLAQFIGDSSYGFDGIDIDDEMPSFANSEEYDFLDDSFNDIDFSQFKGDVKSNLHKINKKVISRPAKRKLIKKKVIKKPLTKEFFVRKRATVIDKGTKGYEKVIVPRDRSVIIEGVNNFLLSDTKESEQARNIGYYKGKKLQQLVLIFNNDTPNDFNLELFNPSMPLDYLYSTSQSLNNMIQVAGGQVSYTDILFNILANPVFIPNATITISGLKATEQKAVSFLITNKFVNGITKIEPLNIALQIDNMQVDGNNVSFDFHDVLDKPYVPDGMETITYNILAGNTVTMGFYYEQKSIKKLFFPEVRKLPKMF